MIMNDYSTKPLNHQKIILLLKIARKKYNSTTFLGTQTHIPIWATRFYHVKKAPDIGASAWLKLIRFVWVWAPYSAPPYILDQTSTHNQAKAN